MPLFYILAIATSCEAHPSCSTGSGGLKEDEVTNQMLVLRIREKAERSLMASGSALHLMNIINWTERKLSNCEELIFSSARMSQRRDRHANPEVLYRGGSRTSPQAEGRPAFGCPPTIGHPRPCYTRSSSYPARHSLPAQLQKRDERFLRSKGAVRSHARPWAILPSCFS